MTHAVPVAALYVPVGAWSYEVVVLGAPRAELFRGKAGWWIVTAASARRVESLKAAEAAIAKACSRLAEVIR